MQGNLKTRVHRQPAFAPSCRSKYPKTITFSSLRMAIRCVQLIGVKSQETTLTSSQHLQGIEDAVLRNIQAVSELSDLVRTSFGPNGMLDCIRVSYGTLTVIAGRNKLLINHLGRLFVTSDAATIIREVEVVHPAAKLLVMASQAQESEVRISKISYCTGEDLSLARWATQRTW